MTNNVQTSVFDIMSEKESSRFKAIKSADWHWTFADYPKQKNGIKVFSCFACGGGSTMGYKLAGCDVIGCVEIDPSVNKIYVNNHHPRYNFLMDLREFNELSESEVPQELYGIDILDGSPPCTTFSMAGKREKTWGKKKKFREGQKEQTLDDLAFVFIKTVEKLKPKVVIMENVEGLILGEAWSYVRRIYKELGDAGYNLHHWLLKGEKMGVPQTRHRVFFVACRKDLHIDPSELDMAFNYEEVPYREIKSKEGKKIDENRRLYKVLLQAQYGDRDLGDVLKRLENKDSLFSHQIVYDELPMPTITAKCEFFRFSDRTGIPDKDIISAQTFPVDYDFSGMSPIYICGMSVPPLMIKRIVMKLIEQGVFDYKNK